MTVFVPNRRFPGEWAHSVDARRLAADTADEALRHAKAHAPVRTGAYRASFRADVVETTDGWAGVVASDDEAAPFIEYGTSDTPPFATLRRALEATGARRKAP